MTESKETILVSACLLGQACRYDGTGKACGAVLSLMGHYELIPVCPEQMGGLATPRQPAECWRSETALGKDSDASAMNSQVRVAARTEEDVSQAARRAHNYPIRVVTCTGEDVTEEYVRGARETARLAKLFGCKTAVLKERSPSCGCGMIYDGTFTGKRIEGDGVTASLLKREGIRVIGESRTEELIRIKTDREIDW